MILLPSDAAARARKATVERDVRRDWYSVAVCLAALALASAAHNPLAPNLAALTTRLHLKASVGPRFAGELSTLFCGSAIVGALVTGPLCGFYPRNKVLGLLTILSSVACMATAFSSGLPGILSGHALAGISLGGSLPAVYSLAADWFPARQRASVCSVISAVMGAGLGLGQLLSSAMGPSSWRAPLFTLVAPGMTVGVLTLLTVHDPIRGGQEGAHDMLRRHGAVSLTVPSAGLANLVRAALFSRTNLFIMLQAFPGNIPWGIMIVYLHDFLRQDLALSAHKTLGAVAVLAISAFAGTLAGGFAGEAAFGDRRQRLVIFAGACNVVRTLPFALLFAWPRVIGPLAGEDAVFSHIFVFLLLAVSGFLAAAAGPCITAILLNVNMPETRGAVVAVYCILDDSAKVVGMLIGALLVPWSSRGEQSLLVLSVALCIWSLCGAALMVAQQTYEKDEVQMQEQLDEVAREWMVRSSKQRAQEEVRRLAKKAGEAHFKETHYVHKVPSRLAWV